MSGNRVRNDECSRLMMVVASAVTTVQEFGVSAGVFFSFSPNYGPASTVAASPRTAGAAYLACSANNHSTHNLVNVVIFLLILGTQSAVGSGVQHPALPGV